MFSSREVANHNYVLMVLSLCPESMFFLLCEACSKPSTSFFKGSEKKGARGSLQLCLSRASPSERALAYMPGRETVLPPPGRAGKTGQLEEVFFFTSTKHQTMQNGSCQKYCPCPSPSASKKLSYDSTLCWNGLSWNWSSYGSNPRVIHHSGIGKCLHVVTSPQWISRISTANG